MRKTRTGGTCPDFVAIDPMRPGRVDVIEVSAAYDLRELNEKFEHRSQYWYEALDRDFSIWGQRGPFEFRSVAYIRKGAKHFNTRQPLAIKLYAAIEHSKMPRNPPSRPCLQND